MLVAGLKHHGGNNKNIPSNLESATGDADDLGQKNGGEREEGGNGARTRKDGRRSWRWTREVRVTAVMKSSE